MRTRGLSLRLSSKTEQYSRDIAGNNVQKRSREGKYRSLLFYCYYRVIPGSQGRSLSPVWVLTTIAYYIARKDVYFFAI